MRTAYWVGSSLYTCRHSLSCGQEARPRGRGLGLQLLLIRADAGSAADEEVEQRAESVEEDDDEQPGEFVVSFGGLIRQAVDEHPDPEDEADDDNAGEHADDGSFGSTESQESLQWGAFPHRAMILPCDPHCHYK